MMIVRIPLVKKWMPPQYRRVSAMANIGSETEWELNPAPRWRLKGQRKFTKVTKARANLA